MEYAGALGTIVFDESCRLCDLTEAQVGRNQFAVDVVVDRLDERADHASECLLMLEGKVTVSVPLTTLVQTSLGLY